MATTVIVETDKALPPQGSSRRNQMIAELQAVVQQRLGDATVRVNITKRK